MQGPCYAKTADAKQNFDAVVGIAGTAKDLHSVCPDIIDLDADGAVMPTVNIESNPLAAADFKVIDRSAESRKLEIEVPRL